MNTYTIDPPELLDLVKTKKEALLCIDALENLQNALYNVNDEIEEEMEKHLPYDIKMKLVLLCQKQNIIINNAADLQPFLLFLKNILVHLPVVSLHIAFTPTEETVTTIAQWFLLDQKKNFLLDFIVNEALIGGTIIDYNGVVYDYSLKRKFEEKLPHGI